MNFNEELQKRVNEIEEIIREYLPAEEGFQKTVIQAVRFCL